MTRQKKELQKKIDEAYMFIAVDEELGCGMAPEGAYDSIYEMIHEWQDKLAKLSHYKDWIEMAMDPRFIIGAKLEDELPFV